jgi:hypothetical protein
MQTLKLDLTKFTGSVAFTSKSGVAHIAIPLEANNVFVGKSGSYLELTLFDNRDGTDQYGYEGYAAVSMSKQRREAGEKGPIVGNWKHVGQKQTPQAKPVAEVDEDFEDVPF